MAFFQRGRRTWNYAANSTGRHRGSLNLGFSVGRVQVYDAIGPARAIYMDTLGPQVVEYLNNNSATLQESGTFVGLSLFMMGKSPLRTKPMLMFVSRDKNSRVEAFNLIKRSGIMDAFPGFDLGNMDLRAEFENLQPLADATAIASAIQVVNMALKISQMAREHLHGTGLGVAGLKPVDNTTTQHRKEVYSDSQSLSEGVRLVYQTHAAGILNTRRATAGGLVSYNERYMLHSVQHFLDTTGTAQPTQAIPENPYDDAADEPDCEVTGLDDFEDGDDDELADTTSRESMTPLSMISRGSRSQSEGSDTASVFSSPTVADQAEFVASVTRRLEDLGLGDRRPTFVSEQLVTVGHVSLSSRLHDFSLIELSKKQQSGLTAERVYEMKGAAIPLESYQDYIMEGPREAAVKTTTAEGGSIGGTLSGTPSFVRVPGSQRFQEVYIGKLNRPLSPGDCGSWIRDAVSGKLYGHVIAGSPTTGLIMIIPAHHSFAEALASLTTSRSRNSSSVSTPGHHVHNDSLQAPYGVPCSKPFVNSSDLEKHGTTHGRPCKCSKPNDEKESMGWHTARELQCHVDDEHSLKLNSYYCPLHNLPHQSIREWNCRQDMEPVHGLAVRTSHPTIRQVSGLQSQQHSTPLRDFSVWAVTRTREEVARPFGMTSTERMRGPPPYNQLRNGLSTDSSVPTYQGGMAPDERRCSMYEEEIKHCVQSERIRPLSCSHVTHDACFDCFVSETGGTCCPACIGPVTPRPNADVNAADAITNSMTSIVSRAVSHGTVERRMLRFLDPAGHCVWSRHRPPQRIPFNSSSHDVVALDGAALSAIATCRAAIDTILEFVNHRPPQRIPFNSSSQDAVALDDAALSAITSCHARLDTILELVNRLYIEHSPTSTPLSEEEQHAPFQYTLRARQHMLAIPVPNNILLSKQRRIQGFAPNPGSHIKLVHRPYRSAYDSKGTVTGTWITKRDVYLRHLQATQHVAPVQNLTFSQRLPGLRLMGRPRVRGIAPHVSLAPCSWSVMESPLVFSELAPWHSYGKGVGLMRIWLPRNHENRTHDAIPQDHQWQAFSCQRSDCDSKFKRQAGLEPRVGCYNGAYSSMPGLACRPWQYPRPSDRCAVRLDNIQDHPRDDNCEDTKEGGQALNQHLALKDPLNYPDRIPTVAEDSLKDAGHGGKGTAAVLANHQKPHDGSDSTSEELPGEHTIIRTLLRSEDESRHSARRNYPT